MAKYSANRRVNIFLILLILLSFSCTPSSKDAYLSRFERFVNNVKEHHNKYNKGDWEYADERFKRFSKEWYNLYKNELSSGDEIKVAALIARYQSYKGVGKLKNFYNDVLKQDTNKIREKIKYYIDNDMDEDVEKLKEGAKEIGDSTLKVVNDIIREFDNKF
jgi:hypothetical protein